MRHLAVVVAVGIIGCGPPGPQPGSKVYVAEEEKGSIAVIDARTKQVLKSIDLTAVAGGEHTAFMPHNVQVAPDGKSVWVTAPSEAPAGHSGHAAGEEQVIVIDAATDEIVQRITLGTQLHLAHVVVDGDSRFAYATANETSRVYQLDVAAKAIVTSFDLGAGKKPHGASVCGEQVITANMDGKGMSLIHPGSGHVEEVALGGVAVQVACTRDGKYVFASLYDTKEVVRYERSSGALTRIALPEGSQGPVQLYPAPDGARLFVCDQGMLLGRPASNRLYEIAIAEARVVATIEVGSGAHGVVVSEEGAWAYVTNLAGNSLSVVDTAARRVVATISLGASPNGVSHLHPNGGMP
ncbi:MAG: YncE family protein [Archangiaceae bacterium]|nr:YncE family protein [Archangiaceae bacterium]